MNPNPNEIIYTNIGRINRIYPGVNEMSAMRRLYYETHILPTEEDYLQQMNNYPTLYLVLYWLKLEHLYDDFLEEEMDVEAVQLMEENDIRYFNMEGIGVYLFRQYIAWLRLENTNGLNENMNIIPRYIHTTITNIV